MSQFAVGDSYRVRAVGGAERIVSGEALGPAGVGFKALFVSAVVF